jgi:hypothetical protein
LAPEGSFAIERKKEDDLGFLSVTSAVTGAHLSIERLHPVRDSL